MHQLGGHQRALLAGVDAHGLAVFEEEEGRQGAARLDAAGGDQLGRFEDVNGGEIAIFGFAFVDVGEGGIGGAEVDADFHGIEQYCRARVGRALSLRRPLRPPLFFRKTGIYEEQLGHGPRAGRGPAPRFPRIRSIFAKTKWHWALSHAATSQVASMLIFAPVLKITLQ